MKAYSRRVAGVTPQPVFAYLKILLGGKELSTVPPKPNFLQGFEFTRLEGAGTSATITIFDYNWDEIELLLSRNSSDVIIQYGYYPNGAESPEYHMRLMNYTISFRFTGVILNINAVSEGYVESLSPRTITTGTYNPSEAVKAICDEMGWKYSDETIDQSDLVERDNPYNLNNEEPIAYIANVITQEATSDREIFTFRLDEESQPPTAYFKKMVYGMYEETDSMKTYVYQKGYDSVVLNLEFHMKGIFGGIPFEDRRTTTGYTGSIIDPTTKLPSTISENIDTVVTTTTGKYRGTNANQSIQVANTSGYTVQQYNNILTYGIKRASSMVYEATMSIVGDPTIRIFENIRIINVTDAGYLHHTSGIYWVKGITDSIQGGQLITTLELMRTGDIAEGLELINYRTLLK